MADDSENAGRQLPRSLFPWVLYLDEKIRLASFHKSEHDLTTTARFVADTYGVPERVFEDYICREIEEAESCWSLPFTLALVVSYMGMMITHRRAPLVRSVENSIQINIEKNANFAFTGPYTGFKGVHDVNSPADFWSFIRLGLLPLLFQQSAVFHEGANQKEMLHLQAYYESLTLEDMEAIDWTLVGLGAPTLAPTPGPTLESRRLSQLGDVHNCSHDNASLTCGDSQNCSLYNISLTCGSDVVLEVDELSPGETPRYARGYLQEYNRIIGGLRLRQERSEGEYSVPNGCEYYSWALTFYKRECAGGYRYELKPDVLRGRWSLNPSREVWLWAHDDLDTTLHTTATLETSNWLDEYTQKIEIALPVYNGEHGLHTLTFVNFYFSRGGHIWKLLIPGSVFESMYEISFSAWTYVFDFVWFACLAWIVCSEAREVHGTLRNYGFKGLFTQYFNFWNAVDWISVLFGVVILLVAAAHGSEVNAISEMMANFGGTDEGRRRVEYRDMIGEYLIHLTNAIGLDNGVRSLLAFYPMVIGLRLLKAFAAQPRLSLVTETLRKAGSDLMHFLLVFCSIFFSFVVAAVILFGREVEDFAVIGRSIMTCFRITMGDFDWEGISEVGRVEAGVWFLLYMCLVVLLMFNIVVAIIMDAYSEVKEKIGQTDTLVDEFRQTWARTRGYQRGELVALQKVLAQFKLHKKHMPKVFVASEGVTIAPQVFQIQEQIDSLLNEEGELRMVTVVFLRSWILKMRTAQAHTLLEEAVNFFAKDHEDSTDMEQMAQLIREVGHCAKKIENQILFADDASDSDEEEDDQEIATSEQQIDVQRKQEADERSKREFYTELNLVKSDLERANVLIGLAEWEDDVNQHILAAVGPTLHDDSVHVEDMEDDALLRSTNDELADNLGKLQDDCRFGRQVKAEAKAAITELEKRLLRIAEDAAGSQYKWQQLRQQVSALAREKKLALADARQGAVHADAAIVSREEIFETAKNMSLENKHLEDHIIEMERLQIELEKEADEERAARRQRREFLDAQLVEGRRVFSEAGASSTQVVQQLSEQLEKVHAALMADSTSGAAATNGSGKALLGKASPGDQALTKMLQAAGAALGGRGGAGPASAAIRPLLLGFSGDLPGRYSASTDGRPSSASSETLPRIEAFTSGESMDHPWLAWDQSSSPRNFRAQVGSTGSAATGSADTSSNSTGLALPTSGAAAQPVASTPVASRFLLRTNGPGPDNRWSPGTAAPTVAAAAATGSSSASASSVRTAPRSVSASPDVAAAAAAASSAAARASTAAAAAAAAATAAAAAAAATDRDAPLPSPGREETNLNVDFDADNYFDNDNNVVGI